MKTSPDYRNTPEFIARYRAEQAALARSARIQGTVGAILLSVAFAPFAAGVVAVIIGLAQVALRSPSGSRSGGNVASIRSR